LVLSLLLVFLAIAFYTLFERKVLRLRQLRVGPVKVRFWGLLQPVLDGLKLFTKEMVAPHSTLSFGFYCGPLIAISFMVLLWQLMVSQGVLYGFFFWLLAILGCIGALVYSTLFAG
jgi:NADH-quinone oxidoreductase subunit H